MRERRGVRGVRRLLLYIYIYILGRVKGSLLKKGEGDEIIISEFSYKGLK